MNNQSTTRIHLNHVSKSFGMGDAAVLALDDVSLTVERGEFIAVMGPSGCGKTTLLNIIGLLDHPTDGEYYLDGEPVDTLTSQYAARVRSTHIGFIFQNFNLIPRLTVIDNVALPLTYKGVSKFKRLQEADRVLKTFHLSEREYYLPHQLSGGQVQRVAIARALVNNPSIILADEPTGSLDSRTSHIIMEELADLHRRGHTIIMVTHNPELTSYASRVITMLDGRIDTDDNRGGQKFVKKLNLAAKPTSRSTKQTQTQSKPTSHHEKATKTTARAKKPLSSDRPAKKHQSGGDNAAKSTAADTNPTKPTAQANDQTQPATDQSHSTDQQHHAMPTSHPATETHSSPNANNAKASPDSTKTADQSTASDKASINPKESPKGTKAAESATNTNKTTTPKEKQS